MPSVGAMLEAIADFQGGDPSKVYRMVSCRPGRKNVVITSYYTAAIRPTICGPEPSEAPVPPPAGYVSKWTPVEDGTGLYLGAGHSAIHVSGVAFRKFRFGICVERGAYDSFYLYQLPTGRHAEIGAIEPIVHRSGE
jgi:hypothetical protein